MLSLKGVSLFNLHFDTHVYLSDLFLSLHLGVDIIYYHWLDTLVLQDVLLCCLSLCGRHQVVGEL